MSGLKPAYVASVIRKAKEGKLTTGQAARILPKTAIDIYVVRSGKKVVVFDGRLWALAEDEKRQQEPKSKLAGVVKYIPGPNHPRRRYVSKAKKD